MPPEIAKSFGMISAGAGIGLSVVGMGLGVGLIIANTIQSIARQPEMAKSLQGLMWIGVALVEGMALMGIVFCAFVIKG